MQESPEPTTNTLMMLTISNAINLEWRLVAKDIVQQVYKWKTSLFSFGYPRKISVFCRGLLGIVGVGHFVYLMWL